MSISVGSDSTTEMVMQVRNLPPTSPCHQNRHTGSSQQGSSSSDFKEVVQLKDGKWGARITHNCKRYKLGTYATQIEAARAYDRAVVKMPRAHSLNFHWSDYSVEESAFQSRCSIEQVLSMLQDETYSSMLMNFKLNYSSCIGFHAEIYMKEQGISFDLLVKKELSDMDLTHNCFLVQGVYASLHVPPKEDEGWNHHVKVYDIHRRSWTFGCSYWHSTRTYTFTSGWGDFLLMYKLKVKDTIAIYRCQSKGAVVGRKFYFINVLRSTAASSAGIHTEQNVGLRGIKLFGVEISFDN